ncbi:hypothetical protein Efla_005187 [Eimeria flavescens]
MEETRTGSWENDCVSRDSSGALGLRPFSLTRWTRPADRGGDAQWWHQEGSRADFMGTVASIVAKASFFNLYLRDLGLQLIDYIEGLHFKLSVSEVTRLRTMNETLKVQREETMQETKLEGDLLDELTLELEELKKIEETAGIIIAVLRERAVALS